MRTQQWLTSRLEYLWHKHFGDIVRHNEVQIIFGRAAAVRLGSIRQLDRHNPHSATLIRVNGLFADPAIPEFVIDEVICHELSHYAHGFQSPHPQLHRHPHYGGVVKKELVDRGLQEMLHLSKTWLKSHWPAVIRQAQKQGALPRRRRLHYGTRLRRRVYFLSDWRR